MEFKHIKIPKEGEIIHFDSTGNLIVPDNPVIPFIEGDGIGSDITPTMIDVVNNAVFKAYGEDKKISWMEIYCGEKSVEVYGEGNWLPSETLLALETYLVGIKGPLTTPVGGGIRSLNVSLRQELDLYVCQRPIRYFEGVPSPVVSPEKTDMIIFRENSEDIYAGIEWEANSDEAKKLLNFLTEELSVTKIRFLENCGIGIKTVSKQGTDRLVDKAIQYAITNDKSSVTLVHKGNIMKFTEGSFKDWGYKLAAEKYEAEELDGGPWHKMKNPLTGNDIIIKDVIADAFLQQILTRPDEYSVIATLNLNGDYISDALAAEVGGIGIAPGANLGDKVALFEATHGTAPKYTGLDKVNPGSLILSAEMMLRYLDWVDAADLIIKGLSKTIKNKTVTYDFERLMSGAILLKCSEFGEAIIDNMN
tara:strand:- start:46 stop:1305 length:1260 start_codon:yes stop_codon:yes gene_type:complete